jgi:cyclohexanone monooxygenase
MIADQEKLRDKALFQSELVSLKWNDILGQWIGRTNCNDTIRASFVISAIGMLNNVHLPGLPGIEDFKGHSFHTARWDYTYTGGDRFGATLDKLRSKRIGLIGTGATTIQVLPQLAASGAEVYVFQRTPSTVDERNNFETDQDWFSSIKREPGWQDERCANFDAMITGENPGSDMIQDGWTKHIFAVHEDSSSDAPFTEKLKLAEVAKMEALRARVDKVVKKKEVAEDLKAWYGRTCKRPCFNDEYLTAFNLPNVHLVHTDGQGVESVNATGVVANKRQYDLDCIIYATGFDWGTDYTARANMVITGKDGVTLKEKWRDGPSTLHGMFSRGFPNLLIFTHLQSSTAPNYTHLLKSRAFHAAWIISECMKRHIRTIEPDQDAEDAWVKKLEDLARGHLEYFRQCTPGKYSFIT